MKLTKTALYKLVLIVAVLAAVLEFFSLILIITNGGTLPRVLICCLVLQAAGC